MFTDLLSRQFYDNQISAWLIAFSLIVGAIVLSKTLYWVIGSIIKKIASKTKTRLDDILLDMLEEPLVFGLAIIGIWFSIHTLSFSDKGLKVIDKAYFFVIVFNVAWFVARLLDALIKEYIVPLTEKSTGDLDNQLLPIIRKGLKFVIWTMAIIVGLNNAGYDVGALIAGLGIGGLAFALAAQDTVSNLFGGVTIFLDKTFSINDRVEINGHDGHVREIGLRSTRLETLEGRMVTIPNSSITKTATKNISSEPSRKVVLNLGLTYDTDEKKMQLAMDLLKRIGTEHTSLEEKLIIGFNAFNDASLNLIFIYYIKSGCDILAAQTEINMEILKQFNENKLEFAFPTQTIYHKPV